ncbi:hypothetical protein BDV96DRAFT_639862 [Lophiotrema nucula]|uniref:Uncharacterized protein n=1 Tax=Lophiotrema nucula TaxID=690887 RepID=A0A6A5ZS17_9PLEO|nr:hypothetical protein BDV96DRAFT_639862 [Lophiotrema nucula]
MAHLNKIPLAVSLKNGRKRHGLSKKATNTNKSREEFASKKRNQPQRSVSGGTPVAKRPKTQAASPVNDLQNRMAAATARENARRSVSILSSAETFDLTNDESSDTEPEIPLAIDPRARMLRPAQQPPHSGQPTWTFSGLESSTASSSTYTSSHSHTTARISPTPTFSPSIVRSDIAQKTPVFQAEQVINTDKARIAALDGQFDRLKREHEAKIQQLRQEKESEEARVEALRQGMKLKLTDAEMQLTKKDRELKAEQVASRNEGDRLRTMLEEEKQKSAALEQERDVLRDKLETSKNAATENDALRSEKLALRITVEELNEEIGKDRKDAEALRAELNVANTALSELEAFKIANGDLTAQLEAVKTANADLTAHLETCKSAVQGRPPSEPAVTSPSVRSEIHSGASDEQTKLDNIRKMYTQVKGRYDNLYSVVKNLSSTTRDMPLAGFGEFGGYLTQLKKIVDEAEKTRMLPNGGRLGG